MTRFALKTIYFHADYDGAVSAAMLIRLGQGQPGLVGVDYDIKAAWQDLHLDRGSAVVDFLYHPDAAMWFDHHGSPFLRPEWQSRYHGDAHHRWDPAAPACPPVIAASLRLDPAERRHFADYIRWSVIIDAARYETPLQAHDLSLPHILLSRVVGLMRDSPALFDLIHAIASHPVGTVLRLPPIRPVVETARDLEQRLRRRLESRIEYDGEVAFLDQSEDPGVYQRYLPYVLHPNATFVVGIYRKGDAFNVSVGANPWKAASPVHIGHLCEQWGGGGHAMVGGITVSEYDEALRIASVIIAELEQRPTARRRSSRTVA